MSYTVVTTKVDPQTKKEAMKTADALGLPLSLIIKAFLKQFIRTKTVTFSISPEDRSEEPNEFFIKSMKESEEDEKAGRMISFETPDDAIAYVSSLIENDKTSPKTSH